MTITLYMWDYFHLLLGLLSLLGIVYLYAYQPLKDRSMVPPVIIQTVHSKEPIKYTMVQRIPSNRLHHVPMTKLIRRFRQDFTLNFSHQIRVTQEKSREFDGIELRGDIWVIPD